jgi:hypothetical protein
MGDRILGFRVFSDAKSSLSALGLSTARDRREIRKRMQLARRGCNESRRRRHWGRVVRARAIQASERWGLEESGCSKSAGRLLAPSEAALLRRAITGRVSRVESPSRSRAAATRALAASDCEIRKRMQLARRGCNWSRRRRHWGRVVSLRSIASVDLCSSASS